MREYDFYFVLALILALAIIVPIISLYYTNRLLRGTIDRQHDTIQRLVSREHVTYAEVGTTPVKPTREVYAAWGAQTVNLDEDESRS